MSRRHRRLTDAEIAALVGHPRLDEEVTAQWPGGKEVTITVWMNPAKAEKIEEKAS